ncbi:MAG: cyclase family protein [Blastocatellia bacterium]|nr:cyclase family protein [Blastocatellia bacterium]
MLLNKQLIDLSHTVEHGLVTYNGLPAPIICDYWSREQSRAHYAEGVEFHIGKIEMVANTGTYLDSPFHRYAEGKDLSELPLESLAELDGILIHAVGMRAIGMDAIHDVVVKNHAVLFRTDWWRHWQTEEYWSGNHPFLTAEAAQYLADEGAALVGIDSYNIDDTTDWTRPAHTILLGAEIPIVEHLCHLDQLPDAGFRFSAVPVKVKGFGTFPVRAYAVVER